MRLRSLQPPPATGKFNEENRIVIRPQSCALGLTVFVLLFAGACQPKPVLSVRSVGESAAEYDSALAQGILPKLLALEVKKEAVRQGGLATISTIGSVTTVEVRVPRDVAGIEPDDARILVDLIGRDSLEVTRVYSFTDSQRSVEFASSIDAFLDQLVLHLMYPDTEPDPRTPRP